MRTFTLAILCDEETCQADHPNVLDRSDVAMLEANLVIPDCYLVSFMKDRDNTLVVRSANGRRCDSARYFQIKGMGNWISTPDLIKIHCKNFEETQSE
jgi:hypothetical protein